MNTSSDVSVSLRMLVSELWLLVGVKSTKENLCKWTVSFECYFAIPPPPLNACSCDQLTILRIKIHITVWPFISPFMAATTQPYLIKHSIFYSYCNHFYIGRYCFIWRFWWYKQSFTKYENAKYSFKFSYIISNKWTHILTLINF